MGWGLSYANGMEKGHGGVNDHCNGTSNRERCGTWPRVRQ